MSGFTSLSVRHFSLSKGCPENILNYYQTRENKKQSPLDILPR